MSSTAESLIETLRATATGMGGYDELEACAVEREESRLKLRGEKIRESSIVGRIVLSVSLRRGRKRVRIVGSSSASADVRALLLRAHAVLRESEDLPPILDRRYAPVGVDLSPSFDETYGGLPHEEKIGRLLNFVGHVKKERADAFVSAADFIERRDRRWIWASSLPRPLAMMRTTYGLKASVRAPAGSDFLRLSDGIEESHYYDTDWSGFGKSLGSLLAKLKEATPRLAGGHATVLIAAPVAARLVEEMQGLFRGDSSPLKPGDGVASAHLHILDNPHLPKRLGSRLFDDEGTPTERLDVVKDGIFLNPIHTVETASWAGTASTGHGLLDFSTGRIEAKLHNLLVEPGSKDPVDLQRDLGEGLHILNWAQLSRPEWDRAGLARISGYRIKCGEAREPFRDVLVEWTPKEFLADLEAVARDLTWRGRIGCPSVLLRKLKVL